MYNNSFLIKYTYLSSFYIYCTIILTSLILILFWQPIKKVNFDFVLNCGDKTRYNIKTNLDTLCNSIYWQCAANVLVSRHQKSTRNDKTCPLHKFGRGKTDSRDSQKARREVRGEGDDGAGAGHMFARARRSGREERKKKRKESGSAGPVCASNDDDEPSGVAGFVSSSFAVLSLSLLFFPPPISSSANKPKREWMTRHGVRDPWSAIFLSGPAPSSVWAPGSRKISSSRRHPVSLDFHSWPRVTAVARETHQSWNFKFDSFNPLDSTHKSSEEKI